LDTISHHINALESFHISSLQRILGFRWWHKVTLEFGIQLMLMQRQLRWIGHVIRMPSNRLRHRILYGELLSGRRYPGGQKKRFSDKTKLIVKCCHIPPEQLEALASDRQIWRDTCDSGLATFLAEYESAAENLRVRRHQPATVPRLVTVVRTATGLVRRPSACTAITVPTENDYNICSGASSSSVDGLPQASKQACFKNTFA